MIVVELALLAGLGALLIVVVVAFPLAAAVRGVFGVLSVIVVRITL